MVGTPLRGSASSILPPGSHEAEPLEARSEVKILSGSLTPAGTPLRGSASSRLNERDSGGGASRGPFPDSGRERGFLEALPHYIVKV